MIIGHVYYQEPVRVMSQIYYSSVILILGNDAEQGLVFHCPQGSTLLEN
jgi:hypothetical protein